MKELGQYPTPNGVVGFMFDRALQYVSTKCPKILEPACGDGRFLKEAYKRLFPCQNIMNMLYGVDIDPKMVEKTKRALYDLGAPKKAVDTNIRTGNFLIIPSTRIINSDANIWDKAAPIDDFGHFDLIIGNPPYVRQERIPYRFKEYLREHYDVFHGRGDLCIYFFERSIRLLRKGGILCFISTDKYTRTTYGKKLRRLLLKYKILEYISFKKGPFKGIGVNASIIILKKEKAGKKHEILVSQL